MSLKSHDKSAFGFEVGELLRSTQLDLESPHPVFSSLGSRPSAIYLFGDLRVRIRQDATLSFDNRLDDPLPIVILWAP